MKVSGAAFVQVILYWWYSFGRIWLVLIATAVKKCRHLDKRRRALTKLMDIFNPQELSSLYCRDSPQLREGFVAKSKD
jgi:hypothetical protein